MLPGAASGIIFVQNDADFFPADPGGEQVLKAADGDVILARQAETGGGVGE